MSLLYKILGLLILLTGAVAAGYYLGKGDKEIQIEEKIVYKEAETQIVYKDRIVTVIKEVKSDGTVTETTKTEEKDKTIDKKKKDTDIAKDTTTTPVLPQYSIGVGTAVRLPSLLPSYTATLGYRVFGPVWVEVGGVPQEKQASIGVRIEL